MLSNYQIVNPVKNKSIANLTVLFGLVNIGVKLYLAAKPNTIAFNLINSRTGNRVKQAWIDSQTSRRVNSKNIIKGYEYKKDKYITFTNKEIADILKQEDSNQAKIVEFVDPERIQPIHVEKTYYLEPDKGMGRSYKILQQALQRTNKIGICKYFIQNKEHLGAIRYYNQQIIMHQLYFADEIRSIDNPLIEDSVSDAEIALAERLIIQLSSDDFDITKYNNSSFERFSAAVRGKQDSSKEEMSDMEALQASLKKRRKTISNKKAR